MSELRVERDMIDITATTEENPNWAYTCPCGDIITCYNMPRQKFVKWEYDRDGEWIAIMSSHCRVCWKRVPDIEMAHSRRLSTHKQFMPGLSHFYVDNREVPEAEWQAELNKRKGIEDGTD